ncbi:MAG: carboxylesterase/lipase family protein [Acidobacteriota bacterium]|nr:carboxylesterase/lipase family protein [Acidobacteriota bacterium]
MSKRKQDFQAAPVGRRSLLKGAATLAGGALLPASAISAIAEPIAPAAVNAINGCSNAIFAGSGKAVVETTAGKVSGCVRNGIFTYKGIPYAAPVAGEARFMPPTKAKPWAGVRSSMQYGQVSPQVARTGWANDEEAWLFSWDDGIPGEDCLRVNVWTPGINDNKKRPVMVWLHGGGFQAGSGQELPSYDGENLAKRGDVVVVSLNHRLGILGYLNLAEIGGAKYSSAANVGSLDLVAALEWVRDNIANFGGDPSNVTIFGQSGGGGKVSSLMAMPAAKGLFHKAIVQSGSGLRMVQPETSAKVAAAVLAELNLNGNHLDQLHKLPVQTLIAAGAAAMRKVSGGGGGGFRVFQKRADRAGWGPTVDGKILPQHPFDPAAPAISANVPMLIGTTLNEFAGGINNPNVDALTEAELAERIKTMYGERSGQILAAYRKANPTAKPFDLFSFISTVPTRHNAVTQAELKAAQKAAAVYQYLFTWQTPVLDGRPKAFHCAELAFCFDNIDRCVNMTGGGADARALAAKMSEAWIAFARKGDPNHAGLPKWPGFTADKPATMIFDNKCEVKNDPDRTERRSITQS